MAVQRTRFRSIDQNDVDYYERNASVYTYPYVCHGCGARMGAGRFVFCTLINTTNDSVIWGRCCADIYPIAEGY